MKIRISIPMKRKRDNRCLCIVIRADEQRWVTSNSMMARSLTLRSSFNLSFLSLQQNESRSEPTSNRSKDDLVDGHRIGQSFWCSENHSMFWEFWFRSERHFFSSSAWMDLVAMPMRYRLWKQLSHLAYRWCCSLQVSDPSGLSHRTTVLAILTNRFSA